MSTTNKNSKTVKEFNAKEKAEQLQKELQKDRDERLQQFVAKHNELCKEFNCGFVSQTIITGDKVQSRLVPVAK